MLKDHEDAFGHAIHDYLQGGKIWHVGERDDGYTGVVGGPDMYFRGYEEWSDGLRRQ